VIDWALAHEVATLVVGDPKGIAKRRAGRHQNRRVANTWRRTHLVEALEDKAERAGITVVRVDERGTSSHCPECTKQVPKPTGRTFSCPHCHFRGHRDLVGSATSPPVAAEPRRPTPSSRTAEPVIRRPDVTDGAISWMLAGPAWHQAALSTRESLTGARPRHLGPSTDLWVHR
jgi:IS605 OrfB family transposase